MIMCEWDHRVHNEWQWPLSVVHSITIVKSSQSGECGGWMPSHFHSITYIPSRAKLWCTHQLRVHIIIHSPYSISPLPLYAICELDAPEGHSIPFCVLCVMYPLDGPHLIFYIFSSLYPPSSILYKKTLWVYLPLGCSKRRPHSLSLYLKKIYIFSCP